MIGSTSSSTSRATESCTRRSSSLSAARTPYRSSGSRAQAALAAAAGLAAAALATGYLKKRCVRRGAMIAGIAAGTSALAIGAGVGATSAAMKIPEILMVETMHQPGSLAKVLQVIADAGLAIEHLTALRRDQGRTLWEITLEMDEEADRSLYERIDAAAQRALRRQVRPRVQPSPRRQDPHHRHRAHHHPPDAARRLHPGRGARVPRHPQRPGRRRASSPPSTAPSPSSPTARRCSGSATSGALAGLPVMEGKAALFADLVGISGVPILLDETEPARVVPIIAGIEMSFGAIQLEDFAAPECFEIEAQLRAAARQAGAARRPARHRRRGARGAHQRRAQRAA